MRKSLEERFFEKVDVRGPDDCWGWTSGKNTQGYGQFWTDGKVNYAHRVAYELHHCPIPNGLHVLHSCDNPGCVNPAHLHLGTHQDNMREMKERGRWSGGDFSGERHGNSKLTEPEVLKIRSDYRTGDFTQQELADRVGVGRVLISKIVNRKSWRHI